MIVISDTSPLNYLAIIGEIEVLPKLFADIHVPYAEEHGLRVMGTIAVLELAAKEGLLELPAAFSALRRTNFRIHEMYLRAALQRDAARKQK